MGALTSLIPYAVGGAMLLGAYFWVDGRGYDRGKAELELELIETKKQHQRDVNELQAKINRIAGSVRARCARGERLPECADLGLP